jgi:hypothetical protein
MNQKSSETSPKKASPHATKITVNALQKFNDNSQL